MSLDPENALAVQALGYAQCRAGQWQLALETLQRAEQMNPGSVQPRAWLFRSLAYFQLGDRQQALAWYDKASERLAGAKQVHPDIRRIQAEVAALLEIPVPPPAQPATEKGGAKKEPS